MKEVSQSILQWLTDRGIAPLPILVVTSAVVLFFLVGGMKRERNLPSYLRQLTVAQIVAATIVLVMTIVVLVVDAMRK